jgi:uncharacterized protein
MPTFLSPLVRSEGASHVLRNLRTGEVVATELEAALDSKSRNRGLLGRDHMDEGSALVLAPCNSIHTFFMRFPIDVAFVTRSGRVVKTVNRIRPWRIALCFRAYATIEFPAGTFERRALQRGDCLEVSPRSS